MYFMKPGPALTMEGKMKHTFKIVYETNSLPICPDAIHKELDSYLIDFRKKFGDFGDFWANLSQNLILAVIPLYLG